MGVCGSDELSERSGDWLLGICFLRGALEGAVEGIGDGEKGGWSALGAQLAA